MAFFRKIINKHTISLASNAAMPVIGMLVLSLMAHNLPKADFGNYVLFLQVFLLADTFRTGFLQTSLIKHYAGAEKDRALNMAGSAWYVGFILTSALIFIDLILYFFFAGTNSDMAITLKWFGIIYLCTLPSAISSWILQAEQRFDRLFIQQMIMQVGFLILVSTLIFLHRVSFQTIILSYLLSNIITSLVGIFAGWSKIKSIKHKSIRSMKDLAHFGKYSVGTSLGSSLLRSSDTFIIKLMFPVELLGVYFIPQRLMEVFEIPIRSFVAIAMPELSAAVHLGDQGGVAVIMKKYAGMLTVLLVPIAIVAFMTGGLVIHLLFGNKYDQSDAVNIFRMFMCYVFLVPIDRFFGVTLDMIGKPHLNMVKVILMLTVNVTGDFIGIYLFNSLYGVAIASIFTFITGVIFGYWQLKKHLKFTINDIFTLGYQELKEVVNHLLHKKVKQENA